LEPGGCRARLRHRPVLRLTLPAQGLCVALDRLGKGDRGREQPLLEEERHDVHRGALWPTFLGSLPPGIGESLKQPVSFAISFGVRNLKGPDLALRKAGRTIRVSNRVFHAPDHNLALGALVGLHAAGKAERIEHRQQCGPGLAVTVVGRR
jgi:hypothetical protein